MSSHRVAGLLAEILNTQIEDAPSVIAPAVWRQAILGQRTLDREEEKALWTSPSAREEFLRQRRALLASSREMWRTRHADDNVFLMAAATEDREQTVDGKGWRLTITPVPESGWALTLRLDRDAAAMLPVIARLRLVDGEGLVWGQGPLGADRALDLDWPHEESPLERLRRTTVSLQIV